MHPSLLAYSQSDTLHNGESWCILCSINERSRLPSTISVGCEWQEMGEVAEKRRDRPMEAATRDVDRTLYYTQSEERKAYHTGRWQRTGKAPEVLMQEHRILAAPN